MYGLVRSAILLAACILIAALLMMPFSLGQTGSGGLAGLAIAAAICLLSGLLSELIAAFLGGTTPLAAVLFGMMVRTALPLGVCVALAATGGHGRQHLAFIGYLLTCYVGTLVLETCLAVKRASGQSIHLQQTPR